MKVVSWMMGQHIVAFLQRLPWTAAASFVSYAVQESLRNKAINCTIMNYIMDKCNLDNWKFYHAAHKILFEWVGNTIKTAESIYIR